MKILTDKKYNDLLLKLKKAESDLKLQINKTNELQLELNECKQSLNDENEKDEFISSLNDRVQKAEAKTEEYRSRNAKLSCDNYGLFEELVQLKSKLSRKGTGTKGSKKVDYFIGCDCSSNKKDCQTTFIKNYPIDQNDDLASTEPRYIDITSEKQLKNYIGKKFKCTLKYDGKEANITGEVLLFEDTCVLCFDSDIVGWNIEHEYNIETKYKKAWYVFDLDFNQKIFNLRVIL